MAPRKTVRLRRNIHLLRALHEAKPQRRKELLKVADPDLVECLSDCCHNIIHGNIPLSGRRKKVLIQKKLLVRKVADKKAPIKNRKRVIVSQRGGGFLSVIPALLGSVLAAVSSLVSPRNDK